MQSHGKPLDFENISLDKKILECLEPGENIVFSWKVIKYTGTNQSLNRIFTITNKYIYNIAPKDESNVVSSFLQSMVGKTRIKRRISLSLISSITVSRVNNDFILHVPSEYDQRYRAENYRDTLLFILCDMFCKYNFSKLPFQFTDELNLIQYTTTTYDIQKKFKRSLPTTEMTMLDMEEVKTALSVTKKRATTIFQRNKQVKEIGMDDFSLIRVLGRGTYGKVMLCEKNDTKEIFAIKSQSKEDIITKGLLDYIKTERRILENSSHPFLVSLEYAFQTEDSIFFVMKFMKGGELFTHLKKMGRFNETMALFYGSQVLLALEYLHKQNVIYRDLKPENILMDEFGYVALADYGLAKIVQKGQQAKTIAGTPEYLAPEVITEVGHTFTADWWCLGIFIYEMIYGKTPFYNENRYALQKNILEKPLVFPSNVAVSKECQSLMTMLLKKKPAERLGAKSDAEEIKKHPWFKQINMQELIELKLKAPIVPELKDDQDLQNFNPQLTEMPLQDEQTGIVNWEALKKFDDEFYGLQYSGHKDQ